MEKNFLNIDIPFSPDLDRVDGKAKVTGTATYSAEYTFPGLVYGVMVGSTIAKGSITEIDTKAAEKAPGVEIVITHANLPAIPAYQKKQEENIPSIQKGFKVFGDNKVRFYGQPIAIVVADTFERALYAASLVKAKYSKEAFNTDLSKAIKENKPLEGNSYKDYNRGAADAWKTAPVKVEASYSMPIEVHNPMELHAITVVWEGKDKVTVYEKTQSLKDTQNNIMRLFDLPQANVRVISQYIGGAFGSAFNTWPHAIAALIAGRQLGKPIKVSLSRDQMFTTVGYRPQALQTVNIGATRDGNLIGITHEAIAITSTYDEFH
jgi:xanthine dehydrogenase YagR molybdenum-binding subunit